MTVEAISSPPHASGAAEAPQPASARGGVLVTACFAGATFLGAFLLFLVQPLIAKYILPWFGGGAAVWTTCMLFFQTALLFGYLYAHLGVSRLSTRGQAIVHAALLIAAALVALPAIIPSAQWKPPAEAAGNPIPRILLLLAATVGLPCLALSATSPLLHAWYSRIRPGAAVYRLFALSNVGSLLALLAYPLVVEPLLARHTQALAWSVAMAAFAVLCGACAWLASRYAPPLSAAAAPGTSSSDVVPEATPTAVGVIRGVLWLALPACASALLLATTNKLTQDIAPVPFLWILPLTLYLLTFIIAFDRPAWYRRAIFGWAFAAATAGAVYVLFAQEELLPGWVSIGGLLPAVFLGCMVLHGELARLRPPASRLTAYYLTIAAGGALGGALVAIGAPLLLRSYSEMPAALWACCALAFVTPILVERRPPAGPVAVLAIAAITALAPVLYATSHRLPKDLTPRSRTRDFYGVFTVWETKAADRALVFRHGGITHGSQYLRPSRRTRPTTYYNPDSGIGFALAEEHGMFGGGGRRRIGVVGLGTGTIAAYGKAGDAIRFYEISPSVVRIARDPFTYLADFEARGGTLDVVLGDARLSLERESPQQYDVLVLDAFSGDAVPVHLLTLEAFKEYQRQLTPGGVLCVNVSNRYLNLQVVVTAAGRQIGWPVAVHDSDDDAANGYFGARWMLLSPDPQRIRQILALGARYAGELPGFKAWTDEHANVLGILD